MLLSFIIKQVFDNVQNDYWIEQKCSNVSIISSTSTNNSENCL